MARESFLHMQEMRDDKREKERGMCERDRERKRMRDDKRKMLA